MAAKTLKNMKWLAERLGVGITTLRRLRSAGSPEVPTAIKIGRLVRYEEAAVDQWLLDRCKAETGEGAHRVAP